MRSGCESREGLWGSRKVPVALAKIPPRLIPLPSTDANHPHRSASRTPPPPPHLATLSRLTFAYVSWWNFLSHPAGLRQPSRVFIEVDGRLDMGRIHSSSVQTREVVGLLMLISRQCRCTDSKNAVLCRAAGWDMTRPSLLELYRAGVLSPGLVPTGWRWWWEGR